MQRPYHLSFLSIEISFIYIAIQLQETKRTNLTLPAPQKGKRMPSSHMGDPVRTGRGLPLEECWGRKG